MMSVFKSIAGIIGLGYGIAMFFVLIFGSGCAINIGKNGVVHNDALSGIMLGTNRSAQEGGDGGQTNSAAGGGGQTVFEPKDDPEQ